MCDHEFGPSLFVEVRRGPALTDFLRHEEQTCVHCPTRRRRPYEESRAARPDLPRPHDGGHFLTFQFKREPTGDWVVEDETLERRRRNQRQWYRDRYANDPAFAERERERQYARYHSDKDWQDRKLNQAQCYKATAAGMSSQWRSYFKRRVAEGEAQLAASEAQLAALKNRAAESRSPAT